jgi:hypothetical protein
MADEDVNRTVVSENPGDDAKVAEGVAPDDDFAEADASASEYEEEEEEGTIMWKTIPTNRFVVWF